MERTYHSVIHQAVEIPDLKHHMLFPTQVLTNIFKVNYCPRLLIEHPDEETHAIIADYEWGNKFFYIYVYLGLLIIYLFVR